MRDDFRLSAALAAIAIALASGPAYATDGYFQDGFGARQKALGGAGVADSTDATAIALNPAGLVNVDDQTAASLSFFNPIRSYTAGFDAGPGSFDVLGGEHGSDYQIFFIPNFAWTHHLGPDTVLGIGLYGNGGMDTRYHDAVFGNFGGTAPTGVDLNQAFLSVSLSQRFGQFSVGVAPVLAMQVFKAYGLSPFAGFSVAPFDVSDNSYAFSYGGGVRAGIEYDFAPNIRFGLAGASEMYMTNFDLYRGLFAQGGSFDIPANITAGVAVDVQPNITVMLDYKHIFYSSVPAIGNPSTNILFATPPCSNPSFCLGAGNGPGFGWSDIDIVKLGVEWRYNPVLTLRAGYSYNTNPVSGRDVELNILAPAVVQSHITGGFKYKWSDHLDLEAALMYAPEVSVSGHNLFDPAQPIEIDMHQFEATLGVIYHWDVPVPLK